MVLGNFIVEVVISFGPEDPSVATDRVEVTLRDTDPGESPKSIQTNLHGYPAVDIELSYGKYIQQSLRDRLWIPQ